MKSRLNRSLSKVLVAAAVLFALAAGNAGAQGKPAVTEWDIPMLSVLTGPVAFAGIPAAWGAEYAAKEINKAGGIKGIPIKITKQDTAFNTAKAVSAMTKAVADAVAILGPMDGPGADAASPVAAEAKVPSIAALSFPDARERLKPWGIACMQDSPEGSALAAAEWVRLNPEIKSVVVFYMPSDPAQVEEYEAVAGALKKANVKVAGTVEMQTGQLDMGPAVVRAMNLKGDGYFCILRAGEYAKVATELSNRGMTDGKRICATFAAMSPSLMDMAKGKLNNTYIWDKVDLGLNNAKWKALVDAYKAEHGGQNPIGTAVYFYDAVYAIKAAIETLNITGDKSKLADERKKIADFLFNSKEFDGVQGKFKWVNGKRVAPYHFFQIKDEKLVRITALTAK
jgi:branched-chain amino acid transport system substrate-binding protein